jgi:hypothetical protein
MLAPQFILPLAAELVVDLFAGGGDAATFTEVQQAYDQAVAKGAA